MKTGTKTKLRNTFKVYALLFLLITLTLALVLYLDADRFIDNFKEECIRQRKEDNTKIIKIARENIDACNTINGNSEQ